MTTRTDIISTIGKEYLTTNIENDEFSYPQAFKKASIEYEPIKNSKGREYKHLDIRFEKDGVSILVETKQDYDKDASAEEQIAAYQEYEIELTGNRTICILANTSNNKIKVWKGEVNLENLMFEEHEIRTIDEYLEMFNSRVNDKERIMSNTYRLNKILHSFGIGEKLRSQFVGTCLLALKNNLE